MASQHFTTDLEAADLVFVDDYCLNMRWLAQVHSHNHEDTLTSYALNMAYDLMIQSPRWKRNNGADYIFYDSHPGFRWGWPAARIRDKFCGVFLNSTMLVVDKPMRSICTSFLQMPRVLITPYQPNSYLSAGNLPDVKAMEDRHLMLYLRANCHLEKTKNAGKSFRWFLSQNVYGNKSDTDVDVHCTNQQLGGENKPFTVMFDSMRNSRFCLAMPGDSASTRRLSEIVLSGCIPVFPGPPFNSMPFHHTVDWSSAGVVFNISKYKPWLDGSFRWQDSSSEQPVSPNDGRFWYPDADIAKLGMISITNADEVRVLLMFAVSTHGTLLICLYHAL